jgi:hypothetical protein
MGKWIFVTSIAVSFSTFASVMDLDLNIRHKKNAITKTSNSRVRVKMGEPFTIKTQDMEVVLTATEEGLRSYSGNSKSTLSIKGQIYDLDKGKKKLISSPKVISSYDNPVELITKDNLGNELYLNIQPSSYFD